MHFRHGIFVSIVRVQSSEDMSPGLPLLSAVCERSRPRIVDMSTQISQNGSQDIRTVILERDSENRLGFNIVGGEYDEPIYISLILPGGPAHANGKLRRGDQILSFDDVDLSDMPHEEAAKIIKGPNKTAKLVVQYRPHDFNRYQLKIDEIRREIALSNPSTFFKLSLKRSFYVKAYFDYDPTKDSDLPSKGLTFYRGDILHVINAGDREWWLAMDHRKRSGIIPSKARIQRKMAAKDRNVKFCLNQPVGEKRKSSSFSRRFGTIKYTQVNTSGSYDSLEDHDNTNPYYEPVKQILVDGPRPVVILGLLKDRIREDLLLELSDKFGQCAAHSRNSRSSQNMTDFANIALEENSSWCVDCIRKLSQEGKHCLLNLNKNVIGQMESIRIYPITILIKPKSICSILEMNKRMSEREAKEMNNLVQMTETEFGKNITAKTGEKLRKMYSKLEENEVTIGEYDKYIFSDVKFTCTNKNGPFMIWENQLNQQTISQLFSGNQITIRAGILDGFNYNAVKTKVAGVHFKAKQDALQDGLEKALLNFQVEMTHLGDSAYRCGEKFYTIGSDPQTLIYSFKKDANGYPITTNMVFDKLNSGNFLLSPYATWNIKLTNLSSPYGILDYYKDKVDMELEGSGQYILQGDFNSKVCYNLNNYYDVDDTISELFKIDVSDEASRNLSRSAKRRTHRNVEEEEEEEEEKVTTSAASIHKSSLVL